MDSQFILLIHLFFYLSLVYPIGSHKLIIELL